MWQLLYIKWNINPGIFRIGEFSLRYYSIMFAAAFFFSYLVLLKIYNKENVSIHLLNKLFIYVFTQDIERGKRVADQIDTGMVFINHPTWTQADLPFGGTRRSGYGRELSELGIDEFVNKNSFVLVNSQIRFRKSKNINAIKR